MVDMPIAVKGEDGANAKLNKFRASVVEGSGADLPAILGLHSMQDQDADIILRRGKEQKIPDRDATRSSGAQVQLRSQYLQPRPAIW